MFGNLKPQAPDKILALMGEYKADTRQGKIDLGVGVYKDATGHTPVMRAVRAAEARILETQTSKAYTNLVGEEAYRQSLGDLILGDSVAADRVARASSVAGTGALRMAFELARMANPDMRVFLSDPTWPNHNSILNFMGIEIVNYRYFDNETRGVNFDGMIEDLGKARAGDIILLHGCCHNPTGANPSAEQWLAIAETIEKTGATPMIDLAYQGFGDGLEEDAAATRMFAARFPQMLIAASCSKNFGIYRDRAGILLAICENTATRDLAQGAMAYLNRQTFSFPPDHGARIVTTILTDAELCADWKAELEEVRTHMLALREHLAGELRDLTGSDRFDFIRHHRGMFSRLGASPEQVAKMREEAAIYMVGDSRLNIAGLNAETVPILARAIFDAGV